VLFGNADKITGICSEERRGIWPNKWIIHHDNAPAHDALRVREILAKNPIIKMDHAPYSPNLAPSEFWLFPKLKNALNGQSFADIPDIQQTVKTLLRGILENYFQDCFWQWHHCLTRRIFRRRQQPLVYR
jgi:transposase